MRKLMLISALLLVSASAQAAEPRGLVLAASDTAVADNLPRPLPPVAKSDAKSEAKSDSKSDEQQPRQQQASEPAAPRARPHAQPRRYDRYEANEATARRIAARYGISW